MIECIDLSVNYGAVEAVRNVSFVAQSGKTTAILGANGAGKSSILKAISGIAPIKSGELRLDNDPINAVPAEKRASRGISHAMEGRRIFKHLTVRDNLDLAWRFGRRQIALEKGIRDIYDRFPILAEKANIPAGLLSGGQQQMVILSCATIQTPSHLLLDEPSLGLAPIIVTQIYDFISEFARESGTTVIIAEQMATMALKVADYGYVMRSGKIVMEGSSAELKRDGINQTLSASYL